MTHDELIERAGRWLFNTVRCSIVLTHVDGHIGECPDAIGWRRTGYGGATKSVLVECKCSVADFRADRSKTFRQAPYLGMGLKRYYLTPAGLLRDETLLEGWGLVEAEGRVCRTIRLSIDFVDHARHLEMGLMYSAILNQRFRYVRFNGDVMRKLGHRDAEGVELKGVCS